ncbi:GL20525 [Drosophila persimilis]|uniref:GL20525 n=1 Tax=Drosophila persimilis TaxID=7234 RepID=B4GK70_DROPE|nr:GL20525 [Drosophila persimilis]
MCRQKKLKTFEDGRWSLDAKEHNYRNGFLHGKIYTHTFWIVRVPYQKCTARGGQFLLVFLVTCSTDSVFIFFLFWPLKAFITQLPDADTDTNEKGKGSVMENYNGNKADLPTICSPWMPCLSCLALCPSSR